jgi:hypothetical protein
MAGDERHEAIEEFGDAVNMTRSELEKWLDSDESRGVGQKSSSGSESTGHQSGRRIVTLLSTKRDDLSGDDVGHMRKVVGYVRQHLGQRTSGGVTDTPWRYWLMNWGRDPKK